MELPPVTRSDPRRVLTRAKARLDPLGLYERPVSIDHVSVLSAGWLFRLPWFRRFDGYAMWNLILVRSPASMADEDLICHELCHVWQMQHHPLRMPLSYLRLGYSRNPYEEEARRAASGASKS
jgi:hypothetical protein